MPTIPIDASRCTLPHLKIPAAVRLEGKEVEHARKLLAEAKIPQLIPADDPTDPANKVCKPVA
ncbi:MAG: hypothetical protein J5J06_01155 [Phycisphaerae bacterium]|nr:hypothetical protein [Phycisphaerae bacterium]